MKKYTSARTLLSTAVLAGVLLSAFASQAVAGPGVNYWLNQNKTKKETESNTVASKPTKEIKEDKQIVSASVATTAPETAQALPSPHAAKSVTPETRAKAD